jgi:lipoprotein-releasing system ATP-binding protein
MSDAAMQSGSASSATAEREVVLEARELAKDYFDGTRVLRVLHSVDLQVRAGESISIVGASGAGKSTLLHLLGALDRPTSGSVSIGGRNLAGMSDRELAEMRNGSVGFVFQFHHLLSEFNAVENVIMPGLIGGQAKDGLEVRARELLERLGLGERLTHRPSKLSGGEQQRVALARALIGSPLVILADEPTGNLDTESAENVIDLLWKHTRKDGRSLIIVTHEPDIARRADRCLRLREGRLYPETS